MRTHRSFPALQPWSARYADVSDLLAVDHLCSMRLEAVSRAREPTAFVDLHFDDGVRSACIPLVYVDLAQLDVREADPLVFPHAVEAHVAPAALANLLERIVPELERRAVAGGIWGEELIVFRAVPNVLVARERGLFGAAPLGVALVHAAPAVYAGRFTAGKHVVAHGAGGTAAAAFVRAGAASCTVIDDDDTVAVAWYGVSPPEVAESARAFAVSIGSGPGPGASDVAVCLDAGAGAQTVTVAVPLPADLMIAFDEPDAPVAASFGVTVHREMFARRVTAVEPVPAVGGSSGRVAIVTRADAREIPDADLDEAVALAAALVAEGFDARIVAGVDALDAFRPDLVHLFGVLPGGFAAEIADWATERAVPLAVHAYYDDPAQGGYWGANVVPYCFAFSADDRRVTDHLGMLARRLIEVDGVAATMRYAPPRAGLAEAERVLRTADIVFVNSVSERDIVQPLRPDRPTVVVPPLALRVAAASSRSQIAARVGLDPFVLVHAPIGPEANQLAFVRAIASVGVPAVLAGRAADPIYLERLRESAPATVRFVGEPSAAEAAELLGAAAVVADTSWIRRGQARLATALACGSAVVMSGGDAVDLSVDPRFCVDPADVASIARGVGDAWDVARRATGELRSRAEATRSWIAGAHLAVVACYAKIGQPV